MAIKEKEVQLDLAADIANKDIITIMEEYFGCSATPIAEFEGIEATEQFALTFKAKE